MLWCPVVLVVGSVTKKGKNMWPQTEREDGTGECNDKSQRMKRIICGQWGEEEKKCPAAPEQWASGSGT